MKLVMIPQRITTRILTPAMIPLKLIVVVVGVDFQPVDFQPVVEAAAVLAQVQATPVVVGHRSLHTVPLQPALADVHLQLRPRALGAVPILHRPATSPVDVPWSPPPDVVRHDDVLLLLLHRRQ